MQDGRQGWQRFIDSVKRFISPRTTALKQTAVTLQEQLDSLKSELSALQFQSNELTTWQTGYAEKLASAEAGHHVREQALLAKIEDLGRRSGDIEAEGTTIRDRLTALTSTGEALQAREQELLAKLEDLQQRSGSIEAESTSMRDKINGLEEALVETASRHDHAGQLIRDLRKDLANERKRYDANRHMVEERLAWVRNEQENMHKKQFDMAASMRRTRRLAPVAAAVVLLLGMLAGAAMFRDVPQEMQEQVPLVSEAPSAVESPRVGQDRPGEEERALLNEAIVDSAALETEAVPGAGPEPVAVEPYVGDLETEEQKPANDQPDQLPDIETAATMPPLPFIAQQAPVVGKAFDTDKFFRENAGRAGVVSLPSGLQYKVLKAGEGKLPGLRDLVILHYRGSLPDGRVFDDSYTENAPAAFRVNEVIPGWREALQRMREGAQWELYLPPRLAHGAGTRGTPGDLPLIYQIELISVSRTDVYQGTQGNHRQTLEPTSYSSAVRAGV